MLGSRFTPTFAAAACLSGCELIAGIEDLPFAGQPEAGIASGGASSDASAAAAPSGIPSGAPTRDAAIADDPTIEEPTPEGNPPDGGDEGIAPFPVEPTFHPDGYFAKDTGDVTVSLECPDVPPVAMVSTPCRAWTYAPSLAADTTNGQFFAGVFWLTGTQDWGTSPGATIQPGYSTVTFWARGAQGGEGIAFWVGGVKGTPYADAFQVPAPAGNGAAPTTLTNQWAKYTLSLAGVDYAGGVLGGFAWSASYDPAFGAPSPVTFYLAGIQRQ